VTSSGGGAAGWLSPLLHSIPELIGLDARRLRRFEETLRGLLAEYPLSPDPEPEPELRSRRLLHIRRELAQRGHLAHAVPARDGGSGGPIVAQTLMQFICGYHDADLRDSTGLGHGSLIARHATPPVRDRWLPRLLAGTLPGIAITEPHGGSQVHTTTTAATICGDGVWAVTGTKIWISRLAEADVFTVFFKDPAGRLTAGVADATAGGLHRRRVLPAGLAGWSWGELRLDNVVLRTCDLLGGPGNGMALLRQHFAHYRPLVAATALGVAAAVHDQVATHLQQRRSAGVIPGLRDNALITLGRTYAQINAALLAALNAQRLSDTGDPRAEMWGCAIKAHSADVAHAAVSELSLLTGAAGFTASSPLAKAGRDVRALLYADGIHDSLYRAAGRALTSSGPALGSAIAVPRPPHEVHNRLHA